MENISKFTEEAREDEVLQLAENKNIAQGQKKLQLMNLQKSANCLKKPKLLGKLGLFRRYTKKSRIKSLFSIQITKDERFGIMRKKQRLLNPSIWK